MDGIHSTTVDDVAVLRVAAHFLGAPVLRWVRLGIEQFVQFVLDPPQIPELGQMQGVQVSPPYRATWRRISWRRERLSVRIAVATHIPHIRAVLYETGSALFWLTTRPALKELNALLDDADDVIGRDVRVHRLAQPVRVTSRGLCHRPGTWVGCRAPILWARTQRGKPIPLDPQPDQDGIYTSHFASCPHAAQFRRR